MFPPSSEPALRASSEFDPSGYELVASPSSINALNAYERAEREAEASAAEEAVTDDEAEDQAALLLRSLRSGAASRQRRLSRRETWISSSEPDSRRTTEQDPEGEDAEGARVGASAAIQLPSFFFDEALTDDDERATRQQQAAPPEGQRTAPRLRRIVDDFEDWMRATPDESQRFRVDDTVLRLTPPIRFLGETTDEYNERLGRFRYDEEGHGEMPMDLIDSSSAMFEIQSDSDTWDDLTEEERADRIAEDNAPAGSVEADNTPSAFPTWLDAETTRIWRNDPVDVDRTVRTRGGLTLSLPSQSSMPPLVPSLDRPRTTLFESADEVEWRRRSAAPPPTYRTRLTPSQHLDSLREVDASNSSNAEPGPSTTRMTIVWPAERSSYSTSDTTRRPTNIWPMRPSRNLSPPPELSPNDTHSPSNPPPVDHLGGAPLHRRPPRGLEETNALISQTLRTKKPVLLLYCGRRKPQFVPKGFVVASSSSSRQDFGDSEGEGCGALVCARGVDGGIERVFEDGGAGERCLNSDLPARGEVLGDVDALEARGERGSRGVKGCSGCWSKEVGCRSCGNVVGFRITKPCIPCSKSRVSTATSELYWHFRSSHLTVLPRLNGILPSPFLSSLSTANSTDDEGEGEEGAPASRAGVLNPETGRLQLVDSPERGSRMLWRNVPLPQKDFEDGLVGEPTEWVNDDSETAWLLALRHCMRSTYVQRPSQRTTTSRAEITVPTWERRYPLTLPPDPNTLFRPTALTSNPAPVPTNVSNSLRRSFAIRLPRPHNSSSSIGSREGEDRRVRQRREEEVERAVREVGYGSRFVESEVGEGSRIGRERAGRLVVERRRASTTVGR